MTTTVRISEQTKNRLDREVGTDVEKAFTYDEAIIFLMDRLALFNKIKKRYPKVKELAAQILREEMTKALDEQITKELNQK